MKVNDQLATTSNDAHSEDTGSLHYAILTYIPKDIHKDKLDPPLLTDDSKALRGFHHPMTARLLCPMRLIEDFDRNPSCLRNSLITYSYVLTTSAQGFYDTCTRWQNQDTN